MGQAKNYFAWQGRIVTREIGKRIVEVGCGVGNFTGMLLDREAVCAVDVHPGCVQKLLERYSGIENLSAFTCDIQSEAFSRLSGFRADSCVCLNVLEHVEDDLGALNQIASLLMPGGVVVLLIPAFEALYGPIDKKLGHYRRYTRESMMQLARASRLRIKKIQYMNAIGFFGWWTNAHILRREIQSDAQIGMFDRYLVPWISRIEDRAAPPFGQSIFVVLQKP